MAALPWGNAGGPHFISACSGTSGGTDPLFTFLSSAFDADVQECAIPLTAVLDGHPIYVLDHDASELAAIAYARPGASSVPALQGPCPRDDPRNADATPVALPSHDKRSDELPVRQRRESDDRRDLTRRIYDMRRAHGWKASTDPAGTDGRCSATRAQMSPCPVVLMVLNALRLPASRRRSRT